MSQVPHGDVVPQLHPALVAGWSALRRAGTGPGEDLRVGPARADRAVRPPVVLCGQLDRQAEVRPGLQRRRIGWYLVITTEHGRVKPVRADTESADQQLITPAQALRAGVVAQRPR